MRPVRRGASPIAGGYIKYDDAKPALVSRLGGYCSYCERRIATMLAVEHIQSKDRNPALRNRWENFLLACVNCNSTKDEKVVDEAAVLLPDRDNTFAAYQYLPDGTVSPANGVAVAAATAGRRLLEMVGLEKVPLAVLDEQGRAVALERFAQRMEVWGCAEISRVDVDAEPLNEALKAAVVRTAVYSGYFSVWMTVFAGNTEMRNRLIDAFPGTRASGCFDPATGGVVTPAPNPDGLPHGGKI